MSSTIVAVTLTLAMNSFGLGGANGHRHHYHFDYILPPGPGDGWGFPNDNPDNYGWVDYGVFLPLGADRTAEYFFPRFLSSPPMQMIPQTYYNPFETRGQRYIPYCAAGGDHPAGGPPPASAHLPVSPYAATPDDVPVIVVPRLNGRVEAPPLTSGSSGLIP
jgi:hypothetical protein